MSDIESQESYHLQLFAIHAASTSRNFLEYLKKYVLKCPPQFANLITKAIFDLEKDDSEISNLFFKVTYFLKKLFIKYALRTDRKNFLFNLAKHFRDNDFNDNLLFYKIIRRFDKEMVEEFFKGLKFSPSERKLFTIIFRSHPSFVMKTIDHYLKYQKPSQIQQAWSESIQFLYSVYFNKKYKSIPVEDIKMILKWSLLLESDKKKIRYSFLWDHFDIFLTIDEDSILNFVKKTNNIKLIKAYLERTRNFENVKCTIHHYFTKTTSLFDHQLMIVVFRKFGIYQVMELAEILHDYNNNVFPPVQSYVSERIRYCSNMANYIRED